MSDLARRVVDVPQPEPWHARLVRLAQEAQAAQEAYDEIDRHYQQAARETEAIRMDRAAASDRRSNAGLALRRTTSTTTILAATQQPTPHWTVGVDLASDPDRTVVQPERPGPRFKVGDWVSLTGGTHPWCVTRVDWLDDYWSCGNASGGASEKLLSPAINPALHETARKAIAWLLDTRQDGPPESELSSLPGFDAWVNAPDAGPPCNVRWAAQLERLLGEAS